MARNAHPEVTRTRILDAAQRLFMAQGYEHTSIQNIVDELGDLSKGAIYHHFKSKEAILEELTNRDNNMQDDFNESVMNRTDLTALEKFRVLWRHSMTKQDHVQIMRAAMPMLSDPVSFAANMQVWSKHLPEMEHRIRCLATMLDAIGVPIFDDELITVAAKGMMTFAGEPEKGSE